MNIFNKIPFLNKLVNKKQADGTTIRSGANFFTIITLIIVDIVLLISLFSGLSSVNNIIQSPGDKYPCEGLISYFNENNTVRGIQEEPERAYNQYYNNDSRTILNNNYFNNGGYGDTVYYQQRNDYQIDGKIDSRCIEVERLLIAFKDENNTFFTKSYSLYNLSGEIEENIRIAQAEVDKIRGQYDSVLRDKIANQNPDKSINDYNTDTIKAALDGAQVRLAAKQQLKVDNEGEIKLQYVTINNTESFKALKTYLKSDIAKGVFKDLDGYSFWYPTKTFVAQLVLLLPIILVSWLLWKYSIKKSWDSLSLLALNVFGVAIIPAVIQVLQFLQFGRLASYGFEILSYLLQAFAFALTYLSFIVVPLVGFGIIKLLQKFVFSKKRAIKKRFAKGNCINCNFKLVNGEQYCSDCGFDNFEKCNNCNGLKHRYQKHCQLCGVSRTESDKLVKKIEDK